MPPGGPSNRAATGKATTGARLGVSQLRSSAMRTLRAVQHRTKPSTKFTMRTIIIIGDSFLTINTPEQVRSQFASGQTLCASPLQSSQPALKPAGNPWYGRSHDHPQLTTILILPQAARDSKQNDKMSNALSIDGVAEVADRSFRSALDNSHGRNPSVRQTRGVPQSRLHGGSPRSPGFELQSATQPPGHGRFCPRLRTPRER